MKENWTMSGWVVGYIANIVTVVKEKLVDDQVELDQQLKHNRQEFQEMNNMAEWRNW